MSSNPPDWDQLPEAFGAQLVLEPELIAVMRAGLSVIAHHTVLAVMAEVPAYAGPFTGPLGARIEQAVQTALEGFLRLAARAEHTETATPMNRALAGAYDLGKTEARSGRSADALLSAYRIGARVAWREMSTAAVGHGASAQVLASFAELVFAYIDQLSAASVRGHHAETVAQDRHRQRLWDRLATALLRGEDPAILTVAAERAGWRPSKTLTAVILPEAHAGTVASAWGAGVLQATEDLPGLDEPETLVMLVPDVPQRTREQLLRVLGDRPATLGPSRPWLRAQESYVRALRARRIVGDDAAARGVIDTETMLPELVLHADQDALNDLRNQVLAPLADLKPATQDKLEETLRAWIWHQGRRDEAAAALFVHPQTVRYRMGQLRELFGDSLQDPHSLYELTLALGRRRT